MEQDNSMRFLSKKELAIRYGVCLKTFGRWVDKIKDKIPFYVNGQRLFSPGQVKYIDSVLS